MAQYIEKWDGDDPGDPPSDWSAVLGTSNITAKIIQADDLFGLNRALEIDSSTSGLRIFKWDTPGNSADADILLAVEFPDHEPGDSVEIWLRGSGTDVFTLRGYVLSVEVVDTQMHVVTLYRQQGTGRTQLSRIFDFTDGRQRRWLRCSIRGDTIYWASSNSDLFPFRFPDEEWWDWARRVTDTAITSPGWVGIGSTSTGIKIVRPIGLGTGEDEAPRPIEAPPEHEEPAQFSFTFDQDTPGQPPAGWEIDGWDYDKDDEPEVIVTDEGTLRIAAKDGWAELLSLHPDLQDVYALDIVFRWRFTGEEVMIEAFHDGLFYASGGMWTFEEGSNLYVYGYTTYWDDWDDEPTRPPLESNTWYFTRVRFVGDELAAVHWQADDPPPEEWDGQVQDPAAPYFSGRVGFRFWLYDATAPATVEIDYIGIGIGGAPAPMPGEDLVPVSVTAQTRRVLTAAASVQGQTRRTLTELVTTTGQTRRILTALATALAQTRRRLHALVATVAQTRRRLQAAVDVFGQTRRRLGVFVSTLGQTRRRLTAAVATLGQTRRRLRSVVTVLAQTLRRLVPTRWFYRNWRKDPLHQQPPNTRKFFGDVDPAVWLVKEKDGLRVLEASVPPGEASDGLLVIEDPGTPVDVDIVAKVRATSEAFGVFAVSEELVPGYTAFIFTWDVVGGPSLVLESIGEGFLEEPFEVVPGDYYWIRLRCEGTLISATAWRDGDPEPSGWMLRGRSQFPPGPKVAGIATALISDDGIADFAYVGIGIDGVEAPMPATVMGQARRVLVGAVATLGQTLRRLTRPSTVVGQTRRRLTGGAAVAGQTRRFLLDPRFRPVPPPSPVEWQAADRPDTTWTPVGPTPTDWNEVT